MDSKIRVEFDFDKKEPYIQLYLEKSETNPDMRDSMLQALIQQADDGSGNASLKIVYPSTNTDNSCPQIRIAKYSEPINELLKTGTTIIEDSLVRLANHLEENHVKINAVCNIANSNEFDHGKSYNLMFGIGDNNCILVRDPGFIAGKHDMHVYASLWHFTQGWSVNNT